MLFAVDADDLSGRERRGVEKGRERGKGESPPLFFRPQNPATSPATLHLIHCIFFPTLTWGRRSRCEGDGKRRKGKEKRMRTKLVREVGEVRRSYAATGGTGHFTLPSPFWTLTHCTST